MSSVTVRVNHLARIEGEGAIFVKVARDRVTDVRFRIFEPPRFFEALLRGRHYSEAADIAARICGICPVAYQMSTVHALEQAFAVKLDDRMRDLRRLFYCGEWISSHVTHVVLLHAPDFLRYDDAIQMAKDHPEIVRRALRIKQAGNEIMRLMGGREIHPINVKVGGFYHLPDRAALAPLREELKWALEASLALAKWTGELPMPKYEQKTADTACDYVALSQPGEYPFNEGRLISNRGLDIAASEYETHFYEEQQTYSTALYSNIKGRGAYLVGPLARYNLNGDRLAPIAREAAQLAGLGPVCYNPFQSIGVRAVETVQACQEALRILADYEPAPAAPVTPRAATGYAITEAPRGILYNRYTVDEQGLITDVKLVPPTSQNQKMIETDLKDFVTSHLGLPSKELTWQCEQVIRNYDPCISCATHCLTLNIEPDSNPESLVS